MGVSWTKRIISISVIFSVIFLGLTGCIKSEKIEIESQIPSQEEESIPSQIAEGMLLYENNDFRFEYPQDWEISETPNIILTPPNAGGSVITISAGTLGTASMGDYQEKSAQFEEQVKSQNPNASDFQFSEYVSVAGSNSAFVMSYMVSQFGVTVKISSYMVISNGMGGPSVIVTDADDETNVSAMGMQIVDSFFINGY